MHGRASRAVRAFALYGDTTGETDEYGLPVRYPWAEDYRGKATVVYGHTPVPEATWLNSTICIDTGCVFGGKLTALRYPERELVSVPAGRVYYEPARPLDVTHPPSASPGRASQTELSTSDVLGKRIVQTRLTGGSVTIRAENAAAALEVMSRFAIDPRWLVYLPPTMSPTTTASEPGLLEHPAQALSAYRSAGIAEVVCEEKHMGSRAVVVACADSAAAQRRFGMASAGAIFTRTGRPFFSDPATEAELLGRVTKALDAAELWTELQTDWLILDCELLPWSAKAGELLRTQYAPVAAAARAALDAGLELTQAAVTRGVDAAGLAARLAERRAHAALFADAYRRYCWPVNGVSDLRLAPFQILASEQAVHALRPHSWHLEVIGRLCDRDPATFRRTAAITVQLGDAASEAAAIAWWRALTEGGGEGMVVKPADVVHRSARGLVQPGIKCRGPEYLRIVYGPEYSTPQNLSRLRTRSVGHKRSLALREFALGIEALERFTAGEPLYRVHECVFGVLALESEPVDPRL
jgi:polynucleotide kinase-phosphatase